MSDIEIAQAAEMKPIVGLMRERYAVAAEHLVPYGHYKANSRSITSANSKRGTTAA